MTSFTHTAVLFLLAFGLGACGGVDFTAADDSELAGAGGDVDPGTGGSAGSAAGGTAGAQAGAGNGGTTAGSAGSGNSGSAGAGATGAGGEPSGGSAGEAGSGGAPEPTCTPEEAITTAALPESFNWDGFDSVFEAEDQDYCAYSGGGLCTTRNVGLAFSAEEPSVRLYVFISCTVSFYAGPCGVETACGTSIDPSSQASRIFTIETEGNGYRLVSRSDGGPPGLVNRDSCRSELPTGGYAVPVDDAQPDLQDELFAPAERIYPCP